MRHEKNINHMTITNTLFLLPTLIFSLVWFHIILVKYVFRMIG